jgi:hypothetical protein
VVGSGPGAVRLKALLLIGLGAAALAPALALAADPEPRESRAYADPGASAATPASPTAMPAERIAKRVAEELGVQVLGVVPTDAKDPPTYAVRVMNPPGNSNAALLVSTLLVDAATGAVLGEVRPAPSAARPDATPLTRTPEDADGGLDLRRRTYR